MRLGFSGIGKTLSDTSFGRFQFDRRPFSQIQTLAWETRIVISERVCISQVDVSSFVPISQVILAAVLGFITLYIAWQQWRTNRNQFRLHLFDKRILVYEAAKELVAHTVRNGTATRDEQLDFVEKAYGSRFIFAKKIEDYCQELHGNAHDLSIALSVVNQATASFTPANYELYVQKVAELQTWFSEQSDGIDRRFERFLRIRE